MSQIPIIGDGAWGTVLAAMLSRRGHDIRLWSPSEEYAAEVARTRENRKFLPGAAIPPEVLVTADVALACGGARMAISAVPSKHLRQAAKRFAGALDPLVPVVSASKGIEVGTLARCTQVLREEIGSSRLAVLSGPSHAREVLAGLPTILVVASDDADLALEAQAILMGESFRVYTSDDIVGVELGGALKNVIAIAAGICEGLGFGDNSKAALLTRGLAEITRLGVACGAKPETFGGLSGIGDLITTSISPLGRNRAVGLAIGRGGRLQEILAGMDAVAEGVETTRSAREMARRRRVEMPITEAVHEVLFGGKDPRRAVSELMARKPKPEAI